MKLQVLVSTMHQTDSSLLNKMNIQSDAIVINQCDRNEFEDFTYNGYKVFFLSFKERGIGLSRNNALMRSTADIALFADDDVVYVNNYKELILKAFEENKNADILLFNVPSKNPDRPTYLITKNKRVRWFNCQRYGTVKMAVRTKKVKQANIFFSLLFGGGAKYSSGEDCFFLTECIRKGLKVYTVPQVIGYVNQEDSTWFKGYTEKYFIDKGVFFACLYRQWAFLFCLQYLIRHPEEYSKDRGFIEVLKLMISGIKEMRK